MGDSLKQFERQQDALAQAMKNPLSEIGLQRSALAQAMKNPLSEIGLQRSALAQAMKNPLSEIGLQRSALAQAMKNPLSEIGLQNSALAQAMKNPLSEIGLQNSALAQAMKNPLVEIGIQNSALAQAMKNPLADFDRQHKTMQKILSSLNNTIKVQPFDFKESLLVMGKIVTDTHSNIEYIEETNPNQTEQELITWLYEQIEGIHKFIDSLRNMCNVIDTKKAIAQMIALIHLVGTLITIVNSVQQEDMEIHIYNNYEDVKIETETDGNKINIHIEKEEPLPEPQIENGDDWYSGGDRT